MRRTAAAALVAVIAAVLTLAGATVANADTVTPPDVGPVREMPWKSSTLATQTGDTVGRGAPLTPEQIASRNLRYGLEQGAGSVTTPYTPNTAPQPAGGPKQTLSRVSGGVAGVLGGILLAPLVVNGGLYIMGGSSELAQTCGPSTAGSVPDCSGRIICNSLGSTSGNAFLAWLYGNITCTVAPATANEDQAGTLTYGTATLAYVGNFDGGSGRGLYYCFMSTGNLAPGYIYSVGLQTSGAGAGTPAHNWPTSVIVPSIGCSLSGSTGPATNQSVNHSVWDAVSGATIPNVYVYSTTTNAVVASPTKGNPVRQLACQVTFTDGTTVTRTGASYSDTAGVPIQAAGCTQAAAASPGRTPNAATITSTAGGTSTTMANIPISAPPSTTGSQPGRGLVLTKTTGTNVQSCMTWEANCAGWWASSSNGTDTSQYNCTFQGDAVALSECVVYKTTFDSQSSTPTITDPVTGETVPWSGTTNLNSMAPDAAPGDTCMAQWSSAPNPVEWVFWPVKCALVWAGVPQNSTVNDFTSKVDAEWKQTPLGALATAVAAWSFVPPGSGCGGITVPLSSIFGHGVSDFTILNSCPGSPLAGIASLSTVVLTIAGTLGCIYALSRIFGNIFGVKGLGEGNT